MTKFTNMHYALQKEIDLDRVFMHLNDILNTFIPKNFAFYATFMEKCMNMYTMQNRFKVNSVPLRKYNQGIKKKQQAFTNVPVK